MIRVHEKPHLKTRIGKDYRVAVFLGDLQRLQSAFLVRRIEMMVYIQNNPNAVV